MQETDTITRLERQLKSLTARIARLELSRKIVAPFTVVDRTGRALLHVDSRSGEAFLMLTAPGAMAPAVVLSADPNGAEVTTFGADGKPLAILNSQPHTFNPGDYPQYADPFQDPPSADETAYLTAEAAAEDTLTVPGEPPACWPVAWGENDAESER